MHTRQHIISVSSAQAGLAERAAEHKAAVAARMAPLVALTKVLQVADDRAFVAAYRHLLDVRPGRAALACQRPVLIAR